MAKYEYRVVFPNVPELERSVLDKITVDIYLCKSLRLRRNCNYENVPEYSIITGNAGQKRQLKISRHLWRILMNTVARTIKPLVVVKKGLGHTRFHGKEVYVEEVFAANGKKTVKFITGEIESSKGETIPGATRKTTYEIVISQMNKAKNGEQDGGSHH